MIAVVPRNGTGLALAAAALLATAPALAQPTPKVGVELNKLEDHEKGCRAYFVFDNASAASFESFKLDLVMFSSEGVIARRLAVEAAPLRAEKKTVKLFDIAGMSCASIGQVLLNDVLACRDQAGEQQDCIARVAVGSRVSAALVK
jgi:hypothetical protein